MPYPHFVSALKVPAQALPDEMQQLLVRAQGGDLSLLSDLRELLDSRRDLDVIVVDCLTLWISNLMLADRVVAIDPVMVMILNLFISLFCF